MNHLTRTCLLFPLIGSISTAALAGTVVLTPFVTDGSVTDKQKTAIFQMLSSELDFSDGVDGVVEVTRSPSSLNTACLSNPRCLQGIAKASGGDQVMTGSAVMVGGQFQLELVFFNGTQINRKQTVAPTTLTELSNHITPIVQEVLTGTSSQLQAAAAPTANDFDDGPDAVAFSTGPSQAELAYQAQQQQAALMAQQQQQAAYQAQQQQAALMAQQQQQAAFAEQQRQAALAEQQRRAALAAQQQQAALAAQQQALLAQQQMEAQRQAEADARRLAAQEAARLEAQRQAAALATQQAALAAPPPPQPAAGTVTEADLAMINFGSAPSSNTAQAPVYVAPAQPTYVAPQPVYTAPQPVYTAPQPTYVAPQPVYTAPQPVYPAPQQIYPTPQRYDSDLAAEAQELNSFTPIDFSDGEDDKSKTGRSSSSKGTIEQDFAPTMQLTARGGFSKYYVFNFITFGVEAAVPVYKGLHLIGGFESYAVQQQIPQELQAQAGLVSEWNILLPINLGGIYKLKVSEQVEPYIGGDTIFVQYYADDQGSEWAAGARLRGGVDVMLHKNVGINVNMALGGWSGKNWSVIDPGAKPSGILPQLSAGAVVQF